jgi:hypothetical protein
MHSRAPATLTRSACDAYIFLPMQALLRGTSQLTYNGRFCDTD